MDRRNTNPEQTPRFIGGHALRRHTSQTQSSPAEQQQGGSPRGLFSRLRDRLTNRRTPVDRLPDPPSPPGWNPNYPPARASLIRAEARAFAEASAGIDVAANTDTDSEWSPPQYGIIRHPARRDTFGTAPSRPPRSRPISYESSERVEFIQPIPTPEGPQVLRHHSPWFCHRCGHRNLPDIVACNRCRHSRCSICRPQLYAIGANSDPDRHLSLEEMHRYGSAYGEMSVAQQLARRNNTERR